MDISKLKTADWLMVGGGVVMLIAGFLPWVTASVPGFSDSVNAFEFFFTGTLPWILIVAVGALALLLVLEVIPSGTTPWPLILLGLAGFATLLVLIRVIFNPLEDNGSDAGIDITRGIGMYLGVIGAIVATVGAVQAFQASGGELSDLTNVDKMKESFGGNQPSGGTPAPPPQPGGAPPVPPTSGGNPPVPPTSGGNPPPPPPQ